MSLPSYTTLLRCMPAIMTLTVSGSVSGLSVSTLYSSLQAKPNTESPFNKTRFRNEMNKWTPICVISGGVSAFWSAWRRWALNVGRNDGWRGIGISCKAYPWCLGIWGVYIGITGGIDAWTGKDDIPQGTTRSVRQFLVDCGIGVFCAEFVGLSAFPFVGLPVVGMGYLGGRAAGRIQKWWSMKAV